VCERACVCAFLILKFIVLRYRAMEIQIQGGCAFLDATLFFGGACKDVGTNTSALQLHHN
jgi:hypothetical protein